MLTNIMTEGECSLLRSLIAGADSIVLCCHQNADGDALGAMLGWGETLRQMGKEPLMVVPDQYPDYLQWLPNTEKIVRYDKRPDYVDTVLKIADLVFCLDFNSAQRTDEMAASLITSPAKKVLIDHHPDPDVDTTLCLSHPEMSSASELVFRIVWQLGLFEELGKHFAITVYCGMMTDTGGFTFNSNNPEIFYIISQLLTKRINKDKIYRNVYHNYSEHRLRLVGHVLCNRLVVDEKHHAAYYTLTREDLRQFHFIKGDAEVQHLGVPEKRQAPDRKADQSDRRCDVRLSEGSRLALYFLTLRKYKRRDGHKAASPCIICLNSISRRR